jgi:molybdopterin-guanine dinucleotide biosynthesis protein
MRKGRDTPLIGVVGVCASGKTTLIANLSRLGYHCRHIAQEHSYVPDMWHRLTDPDILIYLEASYSMTIARKNLNWTQANYQEQLDRLMHARSHADIIVNTNEMNQQEVQNYVVSKLIFLL